MQKHLGIDIISLGAALPVAFPNLAHLSLEISKNDDITDRGMAALVDSICLWLHPEVYLSVVTPTDKICGAVWCRPGTGASPFPAASG